MHAVPCLIVDEVVCDKVSAQSRSAMVGGNGRTRSSFFASHHRSPARPRSRFLRSIHGGFFFRRALPESHHFQIQRSVSFGERSTSRVESWHGPCRGRPGRCDTPGLDFPGPPVDETADELFLSQLDSTKVGQSVFRYHRAMSFTVSFHTPYFHPPPSPRFNFQDSLILLILWVINFWHLQPWALQSDSD